MRTAIAAAAITIVLLGVSCSSGTSSRQQFAECPDALPEEFTARYSDDCAHALFGDDLAIPQLGPSYTSGLYSGGPRLATSVTYFVKRDANQDARLLFYSSNYSCMSSPLARVSTVAGIAVSEDSAFTPGSTFCWTTGAWTYELTVPSDRVDGPPPVIEVITRMIEGDTE